ncbi:MAG: cytochrome P450 [Gemmatimonadales bacterium]
MTSASSQPAIALSLYALSDDPYPILARLREETPVCWLEEARVWLVTRRRDVLAVLRDTETFTTDDPLSTIQRVFGRQMLSTEGDEQKRYKAACIHAFAKRPVQENLAGAVRGKATRLLQAIRWRGETDLRRSFTGKLSVFSTGFVLGIPEELHESVLEWYDSFAAAIASFGTNPAARAEGLVAADEFRRAMRPLLALAERAPGAGLLSTLVHAADRLGDDEILANALIILFGGIETTDAMISNALWALLTHPEQLALVRSEPDLLAPAIEESLRWEPAVQTCTRFTTREVDVAGVTIPAGASVQCMLGGANRDPEHFADPDRFDVRRANASDHLAFGIGRHLCLGSHLARLETQVALELLLGLPRLRLDPDHPTRPTGYEFRKPATLRVRWDER